MRKIGIITGARSDYGIYQPILARLQKARGISFGLYVTGMHLSARYGRTIAQIKKDGYPIWRQIPFPLAKDPFGLAEGLGMAIQGFARAYHQTRPDLLLALGDRLEMFAGVAAAVPLTIPVAHIHGGESTEGQIDEAIRHALTKISHLHFVSTETYRRRVIRMGEEPWRVTVSGAPALDHLKTIPILDMAQLEKAIGISLNPRPLLATYHPVTLDGKDTKRQINNLLAALNAVRRPIVFTYPNADAYNRVILNAVSRYVDSHAHCKLLVNAGMPLYFSLMKHSAAMVGNSSSGIIEAASFHLPVVDIGDRQRGRMSGLNVIHVSNAAEAILKGIHRALRPEFRSTLSRVHNIYGHGGAAKKIVRILQHVPLGKSLLMKKFFDPVSIHPKGFQKMRAL